MGRRQSYEELLKDPRNQQKWAPGMEIKNSNGNIDSGALGYQYTIQTTTLIRARVVEQKFYEVPPADFVDVIVGEGAWMEEIKTNEVYQLAGDFESGIQSIASNNTEIGNVDVGVNPISAKVVTWAKGYQYSNPEVEKALRADNWDVVSGKMGALKKHWDLGIQKVAFLGLKSDANVPGLLTSTQVTANTGLITTNISAMDAATFQTLVATILGTYFANANSTVLPDTFVIPMDDYLGLGNAASSGFPIVSKLSYLLQAFRELTGNPNFQIRGLAYGMAANNAGYVSVSGKNRYVLYRKNEETLSMDLPVDFVLTPAGTSNNFQWNGIGAGQFTGTIIYRVPEVIYFDHS